MTWNSASAAEPNAVLMAETSKGEDITTEGFAILDRRDYGETEIAFLTNL